MSAHAHLKNQRVRHKVFGSGRIVSLENGYLTVEFPIGEKKFVYPDAFEGFLTAENRDVAREIQRAIEAAKHKKEQTAKQTADGRLPARAAPRKTRGEPPRANIAFKCNFCDGGRSGAQVGFHGVCSDGVIRHNLAAGRQTWCAAEDCPCRQYNRGEISRKALDALCDGGGFVCYESQMLRDWRAFAGVVQRGENKGRPMALRKVRQNSLCVLTTRDPGSDEKDRYIFAVFLVEETYEGDGREEGYVAAQSKYRLKLSPDEARALRFWKYHANGSRPEIAAWGSGLHRYFDDAQAATILQDVCNAKAGRGDEALAKDFLAHFCAVNGIAPGQIRAAGGALARPPESTTGRE